MATYRFVQGIDYGLRKGTLGISLHMSEGFDGLPNYLSQRSGETRSEWIKRVSGVSCHVAILSTGEVVQMLGWQQACGNLNPNDRAGEYGYYGHHHLVDVLGNGWTDPNAYTLSAELAGFRANGPTQAQVRATIRWGLEMRERFPTIRGATGHHDQSPKACPGKTPAMLAIFEGLGGHGRFAPEDDMPAIAVTPQGTIYAYIVRVAAKTGTYGPTQGERGSIGPRADGSPWVGNALGVYGIDGLGGKRAFRLGNGAFVLETAVTATKWERSATQPAPDPLPQKYPVTVGGKSVGEVELP